MHAPFDVQTFIDLTSPCLPLSDAQGIETCPDRIESKPYPKWNPFAMEGGTPPKRIHSSELLIRPSGPSGDIEYWVTVPLAKLKEIRQLHTNLVRTLDKVKGICDDLNNKLENLICGKLNLSSKSPIDEDIREIRGEDGPIETFLHKLQVRVKEKTISEAQICRVAPSCDVFMALTEDMFTFHDPPELQPQWVIHHIWIFVESVINALVKNDAHSRVLYILKGKWRDFNKAFEPTVKQILDSWVDSLPHPHAQNVFRRALTHFSTAYPPYGLFAMTLIRKQGPSMPPLLILEETNTTEANRFRPICPICLTIDVDIEECDINDAVTRALDHLYNEHSCVVADAEYLRIQEMMKLSVLRFILLCVLKQKETK